MGKRYAFFRKPDGKPYRGKDGKYAPVHLLSEFGKTSNLNRDDKVEWSLDVFFENIRMPLRSAFVLFSTDGNELNETDTFQIVWKSLVAIIKKSPGKPVDPVNLIQKVDEAAARFFRNLSDKYVMVSSLSVLELPAKSIKIKGCSITSLKKRSKRFPLPRILPHFQNATLAEYIHSTKYRVIKICTKGRSINEAADNALNSLNLLRGLWSLFATYGVWSFSFGSPVRKPLGIIHTGPIHTLHFPDGKLVDDNLYWYEPDFTEDQPIFKDIDKWQNIEKNCRMAIRRIASLEYRSDLEALLIRYKMPWINRIWILPFC